MTARSATFDDPVVVADEAVALSRSLLVAFDVDGVLAPIVSHAADAALLPGILDALIELSARVPVGVVSGRATENLERFGFPETFMVAGSHGAERRGVPLAPLSFAEARRLDRLHMLAERAATEAGRGAWVESKPTSVVLHVREADPEASKAAVDVLTNLASLVAGAQVKAGHSVVELATRPATKAAAIAAMRLDVPPSSVVFVGDDITDEDVFTTLTNDDLGIRIGTGETAATRRLGGPGDVLTFVRRLLTSIPPRAELTPPR